MPGVATEQATRSAVTLRGSALMVKEFFNYGINSILYQRGIYPAESFTRKQEYGLTLLVTTDEKVKGFLDNVLGQIEDWLQKRKVKKLVVVLTNVDNKEVLERWEFKVEYEDSEDCRSPELRDGAGEPNVKQSSNKDEKKIKAEIRDVIRQITASVTFLPLLDCLCSFDILIYTHKDLEVPTAWGESEPCFIANSEEVQLRSFSTGIHKVDTAVSYKADF